MVISKSMWPKSRRRRRSVTRRDSVCGCPALSSQPLSLNPAVVTTSVSPSHRPTEYPSQVGLGSLGRSRPSVNTVRCGLLGDSIQHHDQRRRLDDPGQVEEIVERDADGQASRERTVLPGIAHALQEQRLGPRLNVLGLEILRDVEAVDRAGASPDAGQVRLAVARSGAGADRFGLPSGRRGIPGVGLVHCAAAPAGRSDASAATTTRLDRR